MKKFAIIATTALTMLSAIPAFSVDQQTNYQCKVTAGNCLNRIDAIQKKIRKLNKEIQKGSTKYSPEQLKQLEMKLQETQDQLDKMEAGK